MHRNAGSSPAFFLRDFMDIFDNIGNTPLVDLTDLVPGRRVRLYAKAEYMNPSGSVKDRAATAMIEEGLRAGQFVWNKTIIDATSGNTGISYAMLGARLAVPVRIYMPANASGERKKILHCYGATVVETNPLEGMEGAYREVCREVNAHPERYFYPNQYANHANWRVHYETTGPEIFAQTAGMVTHFVAAAGTGGTFCGCTRYLKRKNPDLVRVLVDPDSPFHGIEGILYSGSHPPGGFFRPEDADEICAVTTEESYQMTRRLTREMGLLVGVSSGANVRAAVKIAEKAALGSVIVTVLCDSGNRYLTGPLWDEADDNDL